MKSEEWQWESEEGRGWNWWDGQCIGGRWGVRAKVGGGESRGQVSSFIPFPVFMYVPHASLYDGSV